MSDSVDPRFAAAETLFFVIGAQKSGTTWISRYCRDHPQISVPLWKEHNYWNQVEGTLVGPNRMLRAKQEQRDAESLYRKLRRRLGRVKNPGKERAITKALKAAASPQAPHNAYADVLFDQRSVDSTAYGEICPQYALLKADTLRDMSNLSRDVRFIFIMRDPVERAISNIRHTLRKSVGRNSVSMEKIGDGMRSALRDPGGLTLMRSRYDKTIERLESAVSVDSISYFFYETFFDQKEVDRLCHAIGVDPMDGDVDTVVHQGAGSNDGVPKEMRQRMAEMLAPTYSALRQRFGDRIPDDWMRPQAENSSQKEAVQRPVAASTTRSNVVTNQPQPELPDDRH